MYCPWKAQSMDRVRANTGVSVGQPTEEWLKVCVRRSSRPSLPNSGRRELFPLWWGRDLGLWNGRLGRGQVLSRNLGLEGKSRSCALPYLTFEPYELEARPFYRSEQETILLRNLGGSREIFKDTVKRKTKRALSYEFLLHKKQMVHKQGNFKPKTSMKLRGEFTVWLILWNEEIVQPFTVIGYYNGGFQNAGEWLLCMIVGRQPKFHLWLSDTCARNNIA